MADNFDFTYAHESVQWAVDETGCRFTVLDVQGAGILGKTVRTVNRAGGDGSRRIGSELSERVIQVGFKIETGEGISLASIQSLDTAERALALAVGRPGLRQLRFPHQNGYFMAEAGGISVDDRWEHLLKGTIEFVCPSPFLFGEHHAVQPVDGRVSIASNYFVEPVILWTTDVTHGAPHIEVDGKRLTIDRQVSAGQQIRIDSSRKETRVGGVLNVENIHGVYPQLYGGSTIETSPGGDLVIQYQERWV